MCGSSLSCKQSSVSKNRPFIRLHGAKHVDAFCNYLHNNNIWEGINLNSCADCNIAFKKYCNIVNEGYINCCPLVKLSRKRQKLHGFFEHGVSCAKKTFLYQMYLHNPTVANELKFKPYRNTLIRLCRAVEEIYFQELIGDKKASVKKLWEIFGPIVNRSKCKKKCNIEKVLVNGHYVTDANDIANVFNEYFTQVGKSLSDELPVPKFDLSKYMSDRNPYSMFL